MAYIGGMYTGITYHGGLVNDEAQVTALDNIIKQAIDARKQDSIVSIFMMPAYFFTDGANPRSQNFAIKRANEVDGYVPKNKKLFTYPYTFLCVDTGNGAKNYKYEWSADKTELSFTLVCAMSPNPEIIVYPRGYNGTEGTTIAEGKPNPTETVTCSGFPQCAFSIDSFRAWLAQSATGDMIGIASTGVATAASFATGNVIGGALGVMGMASQVNNMILDATQGAKARGTQGTSTEVGYRTKGIYFKQMTVTAEYAKMIDDFFNRFGYATCRVKIPNRNVRPHWTYTKTRDCSVHGDVPADAIVKIKSIFDSGITFWRNGSEVGQYNLDNSPV